MRPTRRQNGTPDQVNRLNRYLDAQFPTERLDGESAADMAIRLLAKETCPGGSCVDPGMFEPYVRRSASVQAVRFLEDLSNIGAIMDAVPEDEFAVRLERHALHLIDSTTNQTLMLWPGEWIVRTSGGWATMANDEFNARYRCPW